MVEETSGKSFTMQHYEELMDKMYYGGNFSQFKNSVDGATWCTGARLVCSGMLGSSVLK